ncbi:hypothetical protein HK100_000624 [Physocladia obscura]|uniref:GST N-terminal domain-containing protein n=1 Tax=Physocladia obscura TaxID=109957 RepID=A0AAD5SZM8_9FUNG|nr:hypothetical protein HK100_000624 [Physocladia obscura]
MLKLFSAPASPFARKVRIVIRELQLTNIEIINVEGANPINLPPPELAQNALAKIPTLHVPGLGSLFGSAVIVQYLLSLAPPQSAAALIPSAPNARFVVLTREALADGANEALVLVRYETFIRPEQLRWKEWIDGQMGKVTRALDEMEQIQAKSNDDAFDLGSIAAVCVIGYLELRFPSVDWRFGRPQLAKWYDNIKEIYSSVNETSA